MRRTESTRRDCKLGVARRIGSWLFAGLALTCVVTSAYATEVRKIVVGSETRSYRLYIPPSLRAAPVPVVVALHGAVQSASEFETDLGMNRIAQREQFAVVYP